jgi:hypothetical protein
MQTAGISEIEKLRDGNYYHYCCVMKMENNGNWKLFQSNNLKKDYIQRCNDLIHAIKSNQLNGKYRIEFRTTTRATECQNVVIDCGVNEIQQLSDQSKKENEQMDAKYMDLWMECVELRSKLKEATDKLASVTQELNELKTEIETDLGEQESAQTFTTIAGTVKELLSEFVLPIASKYMEQRERRTVALEAAATSGVRIPAQTAPTFQVRSGYTAPRTPAPPPATAAVPGSPTVNVTTGGGGSAPAQSKMPDEMTEQEYMDAVKHLTFDELQTYYEKIKSTGTKLELQYFLAIVRETRPEDLVPLIDKDITPADNE